MSTNLIERGLFSEDEIAAVLRRAQVNSDIDLSVCRADKGDTSGVLRNVHFKSEDFLDFCLDERLIGIASRYLDDFYLWRSVFWNLADGEKGQHYHQDIWPWWDIWPEKRLQLNGPADVVSIWIPFFPSSPENGGIKYLDIPHNLILDRSLLEREEFQASVEESCVRTEMRPGDGFVFDEYCLHGPGLKASHGKKIACVIRFVSSRYTAFRRSDVLVYPPTRETMAVGDNVTECKGPPAPGKVLCNSDPAVRDPGSSR